MGPDFYNHVVVDHTHTPPGDQPVMQQNGYMDYVNKMEKGEWGDALAITAYCKMHRVCIVVWNVTAHGYEYHSTHGGEFRTDSGEEPWHLGFEPERHYHFLIHGSSTEAVKRMFAHAGTVPVRLKTTMHKGSDSIFVYAIHADGHCLFRALACMEVAQGRVEYHEGNQDSIMVSTYNGYDTTSLDAFTRRHFPLLDVAVNTQSSSSACSGAKHVVAVLAAGGAPLQCSSVLFQPEVQPHDMSVLLFAGAVTDSDVTTIGGLNDMHEHAASELAARQVEDSLRQDGMRVRRHFANWRETKKPTSLEGCTHVLLTGCDEAEQAHWLEQARGATSVQALFTHVVPTHYKATSLVPAMPHPDEFYRHEVHKMPSLNKDGIPVLNHGILWVRKKDCARQPHAPDEDVVHLTTRAGKVPKPLFEGGRRIAILHESPATTPARLRIPYADGTTTRYRLRPGHTCAVALHEGTVREYLVAGDAMRVTAGGSPMVIIYAGTTTHVHENDQSQYHILGMFKGEHVSIRPERIQAVIHRPGDPDGPRVWANLTRQQHDAWQALIGHMTDPSTDTFPSLPTHIDGTTTEAPSKTDAATPPGKTDATTPGTGVSGSASRYAKDTSGSTDEQDASTSDEAKPPVRRSVRTPKHNKAEVDRSVADAKRREAADRSRERAEMRKREKTEKAAAAKMEKERKKQAQHTAKLLKDKKAAETKLAKLVLESKRSKERLAEERASNIQKEKEREAFQQKQSHQQQVLEASNARTGTPRAADTTRGSHSHLHQQDIDACVTKAIHALEVKLKEHHDNSQLKKIRENMKEQIAKMQQTMLSSAPTAITQTMEAMERRHEAAQTNTQATLLQMADKIMKTNQDALGAITTMHTHGMLKHKEQAREEALRTEERARETNERHRWTVGVLNKQGDKALDTIANIATATAAANSTFHTPPGGMPTPEAQQSSKSNSTANSEYDLATEIEQNIPLQTWAPDNVVTWLTGKGMRGLVQRAQSYQIDGTALVGITEKECKEVWPDILNIQLRRIMRLCKASP
jgi:hypothetical protein